MTIIGVMGPGSGATREDKRTAYDLGAAIARQGWTLLTGGRKEGVMHAASNGAKDEDGTTIGILPGPTKQNASEFVDIPIVTGMGQGRNIINILSANLVIACGLGAGTSSEISHAIKAGKQVILLNQRKQSARYFNDLGPNQVHTVSNVEEAIRTAKNLLDI